MDRPDLSGTRYVAARLHGEDYTASRGGGSFDRLPKPGRGGCNHIETICADCTWEWALDRELFLDRTAYGRALASRLMGS